MEATKGGKGAKTEEGKPVRLYLSPDEHQRLRVRAAQAGMSMAAYANMIVRRSLDAVDPSAN